MALTGRMLGERARVWGYLLAALCMSVAGCVVFFPVAVNRLALTLAMVAAAAAMGWRLRSARQFVRNALALLAISALAGGLAYSSALACEASPALARLPISPGHLSALGVCVAAGVGSAAFGKATTRSLRQWTCRVRIHIGSQCLDMQALVDTGNQLSEPVSGLPVSVLAAGQKNVLAQRAVINIACVSATGYASMPAVRADSVELYLDGKWVRSMDVYAAVSDNIGFVGMGAVIPACLLES